MGRVYTWEGLARGLAGLAVLMVHDVEGDVAQHFGILWGDGLACGD